MFKRIGMFAMAATLLFGSLATVAAPASASVPIDPAGTYNFHGGLETITATLVDEAGVTAGTWTDNFGEFGSWVTVKKTITLAVEVPPETNPVIIVGTLGKHGISSAKKPGTVWNSSAAGGPVLRQWWATRV